MFPPDIAELWQTCRNLVPNFRVEVAVRENENTTVWDLLWRAEYGGREYAHAIRLNPYVGGPMGSIVWVAGLPSQAANENKMRYLLKFAVEDLRAMRNRSN